MNIIIPGHTSINDDTYSYVALKFGGANFGLVHRVLLFSHRYKDFNQMPISMPRGIYDTLSARGKKMCAEIVAPPGEEFNVTYVEDIVQIRSEFLNKSLIVHYMPFFF